MTHLNLEHGNLSTPLQLDALADMCERPMDKDGVARCPFCLEEGQHVRSHVANHMSTLAFAALRRYEEGLRCEGQERGRQPLEKDMLMSSRSSTASNTSTHSRERYRSGRNKELTSKTILRSNPIPSSIQQEPPKASFALPGVLPASQDRPLAAERETIIRSLRDTLDHDTENYEENLLNYVADLQISQNVLENRVRVLEAHQDSDARRATTMYTLRLLKYDHDVSVNDTTICANEYYTMDLAAKGRASWVVRSEKVRQWLASTGSDCLLIHGNSDAFRVRSPLSLLCAKAASILSARQSVFVLRYFCGLHTRSSHPGDSAIGMANNLLGQLILQSERLGLDLDLAGFDSKVFRGAQENDLSSLLKIFGQCILRIPDAYTIYCIIDGISFYETSQRKDATMNVLHKLRRIISKGKDVVFKLLVTAPGRSQSVHRLFEDDEILNVPQYIHSDAQGLIDQELNAFTEKSTGSQYSTRHYNHNEESQMRHDWWDRNDSRESFVSVEA